MILIRECQPLGHADASYIASNASYYKLINFFFFSDFEMSGFFLFLNNSEKSVMLMILQDKLFRKFAKSHAVWKMDKILLFHEVILFWKDL